MVEPWTNLEDWARVNRDMAPHIETLKEYASEVETIVELGTRNGVSTWAFLDGLSEDGRMWSVDINDCDVPSRVSNDPRWTFIVGDDMNLEVQQQLPPAAGLVFIDTSHEYRHTVDELRFAATLSPMYILCHDAEWPGVDRAVRQLVHEGEWRIAAMYPASDDNGPFGLVVLEQA